MTLLIGFFEAYLKLSEKEEEQFMEEAKKLKDADKVFDIPISYVEKGKAIGEKIGIEKGERVGRKIERNEVALKMIAKGLDDQLIMEMTGISEEELAELKMKQ